MDKNCNEIDEYDEDAGIGMVLADPAMIETSSIFLLDTLLGPQDWMRSSHSHPRRYLAALHRLSLILFQLQQYLKTTLTGMTGSALDYAMLVVSGVAGVQRMTREHLAIALALQVRVFCRPIAGDDVNRRHLCP